MHSFAILLAFIAVQCVNCQLTYNIIHDRAQLLSYNHDVAKDVQFSFAKFNRTTLALNVSFIVTKDIPNPQNLLLSVQVDKMYGTEYKHTGTVFTVNMCKFLSTNTFGIGKSVNNGKSGNLGGCDFKPKKYYLYNYLPDISMFPKFLPLGNYRVVIEIAHQDGTKYFLLHWFSRVERKVDY